MNRKDVFLWTLYDFANSIVSIVFFLYFSQWLVVDKGVSDFWYNMIFTIGSVLFLLTAPILGSIADKTGRQQKYFSKITVLTFICFLGATFTTLFFSHKVFLAALFFLLANYLYQFSFVFYNAFLHHIAPPEKWGRISGIGQAGNWFGQIVGLLITLPLASGAIYLIGEAGRAQTFLPSVVLFFIFALPMLLFFKLPKQKTINSKIDLKEEYKNQWNQFKALIKDPNMKLFLIAYFFFNDAIITASNNFPIFLQNVFAVPDNTKSMILVGILVTSVIGALCSGWITDKIGLKKTLTIVIGSWVVFFPILGTVQNFSLFVWCTIFMGFLFGSIWTVTRAAMTALTPVEKLNYGFSFYTLAERVSTFLGPLAWGLITSLLVNLGSTRYRLAAISMAIFVAIGLYFVRKVEFKENPKVTP
ncbi:MAG TPA: MFS transporter [Patescibacteria group bacterium]|nr:MFS transporter [Patescibacteria group bacterium]